MELNNEFEVPVPIEEAWVVLTDLERIAPCLPGAQLQEVVAEGDDEEFRGQVKVKVGPITAHYKGTAKFASRDAAAGLAVLTASGRDTHGQGAANATITATLTSAGADRTHVSLVTDLSLTGKVAQFGRGVLGDVSRKLLGQFVENLEAQVLAGAEATSLADDPSGEELPAVGEEVSADDEPATPGATSGPATRTIESPAVAPVDLLASAGAPVLKRALPLVGIAGAVLLLLGLRRRRRRSRG